MEVEKEDSAREHSAAAYRSLSNRSVKIGALLAQSDLPRTASSVSLQVLLWIKSSPCL